MKDAIVQQTLPTLDEIHQNAQSLGKAIKARIKEENFSSSERRELINELEEMIAILENAKRLIRG